MASWVLIIGMFQCTNIYFFMESFVIVKNIEVFAICVCVVKPSFFTCQWYLFTMCFDRLKLTFKGFIIGGLLFIFTFKYTIFLWDGIRLNIDFPKLYKIYIVAYWLKKIVIILYYCRSVHNWGVIQIVFNIIRVIISICWWFISIWFFYFFCRHGRFYWKWHGVRCC